VADDLVHDHEIIAGVAAIGRNIDKARHPLGNVENGIAPQLAFLELHRQVGDIVIQ